MGLRQLNYQLAVGGARSASSRMSSRKIWSTCPWAELANGTRDGFAIFDDLIHGIEVTNNKAVAAAQALGTVAPGWAACTAATAGTNITTVTTTPYGNVKLESTTDNEDAIISLLGSYNIAGQVVFEANKRVWMEARIKQLNITDSKANLFCGFAEEGLVATTTLLTASDAMADKDYVGFQRVFADGDALDVVHNTASGGGATTAGADACTIVADTWTNVGMYCDGTTVFFYQDAALVDSVLLTATNFPDGEEMAFYFGIMLGHGDTFSANIDWVKIAQERA